MPAAGQVGQSKPGFFIAEINRFIGGWQEATPRQEGLDEAAHSNTSQPQSLAVAGTLDTVADTDRRIPMTTFIRLTLTDMDTSHMTQWTIKYN
ncbi:hypothetical protein [Rhizobium herbae]